jgi:hypothetical protein
MFPAIAHLEPLAWATPAMQLKSIALRAKRRLLGDVAIGIGSALP